MESHNWNEFAVDRRGLSFGERKGYPQECMGEAAQLCEGET